MQFTLISINGRIGAAASNGDGFSAAALGMIHATGLHGITADPCMALDWFEPADLLGFTALDDTVTELLEKHATECR